jgi:FMN phosphatase YigB (HAD superfamily)
MARQMPKALGFDVFGTVVDWRTSVARESRPHLDALGRPDIDAGQFADGWRTSAAGHSSCSTFCTAKTSSRCWANTG